MKNENKNYRKIIVIALLIAVLLAATWAGWWYVKGRHSSSTDNLPVSDPNFTGGTEREPTTTPERGGGIIDTSGQEPAGQETSQSEGVSSESGVITVFQPTSNSVLVSGSAIRGESESNTVSYRLIDDDIGVIARGTLSVVKGKFSGQFNFNSDGSEGRLDIFNTLENGQEVDVVEIPVRFE